MLLHRPPREKGLVDAGRRSRSHRTVPRPKPSHRRPTQPTKRLPPRRPKKGPRAVGVVRRRRSLPTILRTKTRLSRPRQPTSLATKRLPNRNPERKPLADAEKRKPPPRRRRRTASRKRRGALPHKRRREQDALHWPLPLQPLPRPPADVGPVSAPAASPEKVVLPPVSFHPLRPRRRDFASRPVPNLPRRPGPNARPPVNRSRRVPSLSDPVRPRSRHLPIRPRNGRSGESENARFPRHVRLPPLRLRTNVRRTWLPPNRDARM